ncbi:MAG: peptidyl-prolyl cis-trans isomerase [Bacteroidales bacterium]|nr:peptidyl-prolyl cis-trans isomerase [Bacteroidales bacterium]
MKKFVAISLCSIFILAVWGCYDKQENRHNALARVGDQYLTSQEVEAEIPAGLSDSARVAFANQYVDEWISSQLIYMVARKNLPNHEHIDKLVEAYRRDLFAYEYRKRLSDERLMTDLPDDSLMLFYELHRDEFKLQKDIAKGLLLKVPANAPQLATLRKWVATAGDMGVENIEKYAVKNAIGYDYFLDRWVTLDDIKDNIPYEFGSDNRVIQPHKTFEHKSDDMIYMLYIDSCKYVGDVMPFVFARPRILEIMLNERRIEFNKQLEKALYEEAVSDGRVERYDMNADVNIDK